MANQPTIPTIDLSSFYVDGDEESKKKARETITQACTEYGLFQLVNHKVPLSLMSQALELSKQFFAQPSEEKLKFIPKKGAPLPAGYTMHPNNKNELLFMCRPGTSFNMFPSNPPEFREVAEELFTQFVKAGQFLESILNDCLGLPPNYLKEYNNDRCLDLMLNFHYFPATETEKSGVTEHQDANLFTFVLQDEVGGLELLRNGEWIPVTPSEEALVVNISEMIQVITNNKFKSATHKVVRSNGRSRHSFVFFYNLQGDQWVEPLPQFCQEIGEAPKYNRFQYKEYFALRMRDKTHPPARTEDKVYLARYAIPS